MIRVSHWSKQLLKYALVTVVWLQQHISASKEAENNGEFSDITAMSWWCNQGGGGTAGIAYVGTLCMGDGYNTNLNEGDSSKAVSGYVSAPVFIHLYDIIPIFHCNGNFEHYFMSKL